MAVAMFVRFPYLEPSLYDELMVELELDANLPGGQLLHLAAEAEDAIECCDVWRTSEAALAFVEQRLRPTLLRMGEEAPEVSVVPLHNLFAPEMDAVERLGAVSLPAHMVTY